MEKRNRPALGLGVVGGLGRNPGTGLGVACLVERVAGSLILRRVIGLSHRELISLGPAGHDQALVLLLEVGGAGAEAGHEGEAGDGDGGAGGRVCHEVATIYGHG